MSIAVGNTSHNATTVADTGFTLSHNNNGDFLVVIVQAIRAATGAESDACTVTATYNSVSMTEAITDRRTIANRCYRGSIFYIANPSSGVNDVELTFSNTMHGCIIGAFSISGQHASPIGATQDDDSQAGKVDITTTEDNSLIIASSQDRSDDPVPTFTAEANQTEDFEDNTGNATSEIAGAGYYRSTTTAGSYSVGGVSSDDTKVIGLALEIKEGEAYFLYPKIISMA